MFKKCLTVFNLNSRRLLSIQKLDGFDWAKQEKVLMEPFEYISKVPCKHHKMVAPAFNHWLKISEEKLDCIQETMKTFVLWVILSDDMQDESAFRYGVPAAHQVFGVGLTLNTVYKAVLLGQKQVMELGHPSALKIYLNRLEEYLHGQGIDIYWREKLLCPTEEAHSEMTKLKSGSAFAFPVELMQLFSSNKKDYVELASNIGVYYHLIDDYYNLFQPKALEGLAKTTQDEEAGRLKRGTLQDNYVACSDITECKMSLSIIHAMQFPDIAGELSDILKQRTTDPKLLKRAISLLKKHGSDLYMRDALEKLEADIRAEVEQLGGNPMLIDFMDTFTLEKREPKQDLHTLS